MKWRAVLLTAVSILLAAGCAFFTYYSVRLAYVNFTASDIAKHRQNGMYIGAVAFPVAAVALGFLSFRFARSAARAARS